MALNTKHAYANKLYAHLLTAVSASQTTFPFYPEEITNLLAGWRADSWLYLCLVDLAGNREIVKMTDLSGSVLTVERGQGGTTARAWPSGSLVASRAVAEHFERFVQKGIYRSGAYNPNDTITGLYTGEKFYQTGPAAEQRRWWMNTAGDKWRLLTGEKYGYEVYDPDGYLRIMPLWVDVTDPSLWDPVSNFVYDPVNGWWQFTGFVSYMYANGSWFVGKRWEDIRIQIQNYEGTIAAFSAIDQNNDVITTLGKDPNYYCYEEQPLAFGAHDFKGLRAGYPAGSGNFKIFVNEGAPWTIFDRVYPAEHTSPLYWEKYDTGGDWDGSGWVCGVGTYQIQLKIVGLWLHNERPVSCRLTGSKEFMRYGSLYNAIGNPIGAFGEYPYSTAYEEVTFDLCGYENQEVDILKINCNPTDGKLIKIEFGYEKWE